MEKQDIIRYEGDTYPEVLYLKVNGVAIEIEDGWDIVLRYLDGDIVRVIDCVVADDQLGIIYAYPHSRLESEDPLTPDNFVCDKEATQDRPSNQCWTTPNKEYEYSLVRYKTYGTYVEQMTHQTGTIKIMRAV